MSVSRFRLRTGLLAGALVLLAGGLGLASVLQPPRLTGVEVRPAALVAGDGARVVLRLSQDVRAVSAGDIQSDPELPVRATSDGNEVVLTLGESLEYGAALRVRARVESAATGAGAVIETVLHAPDTTVATLVRDERGDRILGAGLVSGAAGFELTPAPRIQEYAMLPDRALVVAETGAGRAELSSVRIASGTVEPVIRDTAAELTELRTEATVLAAGIVVTGLQLGPDPTRRTLLLFDARGAFAAPAVVAAADGSPIAVERWRFLPGTSAVVLRDTAGVLWRADPLLGEAATPMPASAPEAAALGEPDRIVGAGGETVTVARDRGSLRSAREGVERTLFAPAAAHSRIGALCAAPNGRALAVEVIAADAESDGRAVRPGATRSTTVFLDIRTGAQLRSAIGFSPNWC
ncbi:hypothetical protein [Leucobacter chromiireducens]|uniref:Uncharacterized protein n=1 Tax=Leucobacter chromiireducens subsp. chromiireducens TaxID=660067 RepID=A0ABS1SPE9_9MICO|nr:hypothetical protein [Leucobacter chromiireducens]MBL3689800.1 hypothetical protein [Leucobacter chromiireducens subsp. chromiireducens]